jgi:hypothetical protein
MSTDIETDDDFGLLLPYVPEARRKDFRAYVDALIASADYEFDYGFLGFITDYVNYASLLKRKADTQVTAPWDKRPVPPLTVYDVGCGGALQHLVFDPRIHYVGIDVLNKPEPKFFRDNCRFVHGWFSEVVESLNIDPKNSIGIANMSLLYFSMHDDGCLALFDRTFRQKFVL